MASNEGRPMAVAFSGRLTRSNERTEAVEGAKSVAHDLVNRQRLWALSRGQSW
jgi:hypothetical protein